MELAAVSQAEHYKSLSDGSVQANAAGIDLNFKFGLGWGRKKSVNQAVQSMKPQALEAVEIVPDIVASAIATIEAVRLQSIEG